MAENKTSEKRSRGSYGKWTQDDMKRAIQAYTNGPPGFKNKLNATCRYYHISKATFLRHLNSKNKYANQDKKHFGHPCVLSEELEQSLVDYILELENMMIGLSRRDVMKLAYQLAEKNGLNHKFNKDKQSASAHWYRDFMKRHQQLSLRQAEATSLARAQGFNKESVTLFYDKLMFLIDKHNITADDIVNMDETGITTVQKPSKVVGQKGKKQVGSLTSAERGVNTTAVCCMSASGMYVPPMLIFKRKRMVDALKQGAPEGCIVTKTSTSSQNVQSEVSNSHM